MFGTPYDQLKEMKDFGYDEEGQTWFPDMKLDHKFFKIAKKVDWEVLKIFTW